MVKEIKKYVTEDGLEFDNHMDAAGHEYMTNTEKYLYILLHKDDGDVELSDDHANFTSNEIVEFIWNYRDEIILILNGGIYDPSRLR